MIEIEDLHKSFGAQVVLNGVDLRVGEGEAVALLGRSGTGKSVLLKCVVGLLRPDRGRVRVLQQPVDALAPDELDALRRRIGYVFQQAALYDFLTVEENLAFHLTRFRRLPAERVRAIVQEKLGLVGVAGAAKKYPAELSGGMQKRVGIARALVLDPEILLFDEPTSGLDPVTAMEIDHLMLRLRQETGVTLLVITHSLQSALRISDRIAVLHEGRIVAEGGMRDLARSEHPFVKKYLQSTSAEVSEGDET